MSRVYAWEKQFDKSRDNIKIVLDDGVNSEAIDVWIDVEMWSDNYDKALEVCDFGLSEYPTRENFHLKRAKVLQKLERFDEAGETVNRLLDINPTNPEAIKLQEFLDIAGISNKINVDYSINTFNQKFDSWHFAYIDYSRKFAFGTMILRFNYANRFKKEGYQFESDGYITIKEGMYSYVNAGYSSTDLFPKLRLGIEPYHKLPAAMEISLGYRYMDFGTSIVRLFTGSLGKYIGNYWFSFRPFINLNRDAKGFSGIFIARRYLSDSENHLSLTLGLGFIPSDELNSNEVLKIDSKKIGLGYTGNLFKNVFLKLSAQYFDEEYVPGKVRNGYNLSIGFQNRF
jgi:YaiO family outer membrane protein